MGAVVNFGGRAELGSIERFPQTVNELVWATVLHVISALLVAGAVIWASPCGG